MFNVELQFAGNFLIRSMEPKECWQINFIVISLRPQYSCNYFVLRNSHFKNNCQRTFFRFLVNDQFSLLKYLSILAQLFVFPFMLSCPTSTFELVCFCQQLNENIWLVLYIHSFSQSFCMWVPCVCANKIASRVVARVLTKTSHNTRATKTRAIPGISSGASVIISNMY